MEGVLVLKLHNSWNKKKREDIQISVLRVCLLPFYQRITFQRIYFNFFSKKRKREGERQRDRGNRETEEIERQ